MVEYSPYKREVKGSNPFVLIFICSIFFCLGINSMKIRPFFFFVYSERFNFFHLLVRSMKIFQTLAFSKF